jgi:hypothetical protein
MRVHHAIAIVAIILIGLGLKLLLGQFGVRAIPFAIVAMVLGFILKSAGASCGAQNK